MTQPFDFGFWMAIYVIHRRWRLLCDVKLENMVLQLFYMYSLTNYDLDQDNATDENDSQPNINE